MESLTNKQLIRLKIMEALVQLECKAGVLSDKCRQRFIESWENYILNDNILNIGEKVENNYPIKVWALDLLAHLEWENFDTYMKNVKNITDFIVNTENGQKERQYVIEKIVAVIENGRMPTNNFDYAKNILNFLHNNPIVIGEKC